jgi:hypothetical protein
MKGLQDVFLMWTEEVAMLALAVGHIFTLNQEPVFASCKP